MKECKSIELMDTSQMHRRQDGEVWNRIRMSNAKDYCIDRNRIWELFQLMKEYKSIEAMNNSETQIPQDSKWSTGRRMSKLKDSCKF
jgi:hypothetical protein